MLNYRGLFCLTLLLASVSTHMAFAQWSINENPRVRWRAQLPFNRHTQSLPFSNNSDGYHLRASFPFGALSDALGVCQGFSALTAAFARIARFAPQLPRPTTYQTEDLIDLVYARAIHGCHNRTVTFPGFTSVRQLAETMRETFHQKMVDFHVHMSGHYLFPMIGDYLSQFDLPRKSRLTWETLMSASAHLNQGHYPILLYRNHAVMAHSISLLEGNDKYYFEILYMDPNVSTQEFRHVISFHKRNRLLSEPVDEFAPLWNITPGLSEDRQRCYQVSDSFRYLAPIANLPFQ